MMYYYTCCNQKVNIYCVDMLELELIPMINPIFFFNFPCCENILCLSKYKI